MPVYEYQCKRCQHRFEELVYGSERIACPRCHKFELEQQLSVFHSSSQSGSASNPEPQAGCGTCGDPRGPGSCARD